MSRWAIAALSPATVRSRISSRSNSASAVHGESVAEVMRAWKVSLGPDAGPPEERSLVLLGDPRQLDQPIQGVHPPGADVSALGHLLGESATVDPSRGVFLDQTWRMHPDICAFTTEQFYEGRLRPQPALRRQTVAGPGPLAGHGLRFIPVEHAGNTNASAEESECVAALIGELLDAGAAWVDREGIRKPLTLQDVLVVAPYNAHVAVLRSTLPAGARVGTVDKFQGQEAPIVIYSMATSSADEAPRGMEFLYSLHRLNVATSRARCVAAIVASPTLLTPDCRTPGQPLLPLPRAGAAGSRTRAPKLTDAPLLDPGSVQGRPRGGHGREWSTWAAAGASEFAGASGETVRHRRARGHQRVEQSPATAAQRRRRPPVRTCTC